MTSSTVERRLGLTGNRGCKAPVRAATTSNIVLSGEQTVGGIALITGDRCLVWQQTDATQNGLWDVSTGSWTRSIDADGTQDWSDGTIGLVVEGTYSDQFWINTTAEPVVPGTSAMTFLVGIPSLPVLAASSGSTLVGYSDGGSGAVVTNIQRKLRTEDCNIFDFLTAAQQADVQAFSYTGDYTTQEAAAYAAAAATKRRLIYPGGGYRFTANKVWNQSVDVIGKNSEFVIFKKDATAGDFIGITISDSAQQSTFRDFRLTATGAVVASEGIKVLQSARMLMERITIDRQGGHGLSLYDSGVNGSGVFSNYRNLAINLNGGDGLRIEKHYASYFENLNLSSNTGWGLNLIQGNSHIGKAIICESNIAGGARIDTAVANSFEIYGEANTGVVLNVTSNATRNKIFTYHAGVVADLVDEGTNTIIEDISLFPMISSPTISRIPRTTNTTGRDLYIAAGTAGPGAAGHAGGALTVKSGDAAGGTLARGGTATYGAGEGVHGARGGDTNVVGGTGDSGAGFGDVFITNAKTISVDPAGSGSQLELANSGSPIAVGGVTAVIASVVMDFKSKKCIQLPRMTNTEINALATTDGEAMFAYNQTLHKPVFFDGTIWQAISSTAM